MSVAGSAATGSAPGRDQDRLARSYTATLLAEGAAAAQKVAEGAVETALAAVAQSERLAEESADLLFHLRVRGALAESSLRRSQPCLPRAAGVVPLAASVASFSLSDEAP